MLSLEHCHKELGKGLKISDEELTALREQLYILAGTLVDAWLTKPTLSEGECFESAKKWLPADKIECIEERAAVIEFNGNYNRDQAERLAIKSALEK
jgi:hypothetical protein